MVLEGVTLSREGIRWSQEDVRWSREGVRWSREGFIYCLVSTVVYCPVIVDIPNTLVDHGVFFLPIFLFLPVFSCFFPQFQ